MKPTWNSSLDMPNPPPSKATVRKTNAAMRKAAILSPTTDWLTCQSMPNFISELISWTLGKTSHVCILAKYQMSLSEPILTYCLVKRIFSPGKSYKFSDHSFVTKETKLKTLLHNYEIFISSISGI